jgi:predicted RNA-binding Zn-ribbon protein involved in translation (DUF1610 family)
MAAEDCPNCGEHIGTPRMFHGGGTTGRAMHTHRECPNCHRLLIWFSDSEALPPGWRIDEDEERQRERRAED